STSTRTRRRPATATSCFTASRPAAHRDRPSFPTRRSSDLVDVGRRGQEHGQGTVAVEVPRPPPGRRLDPLPAGHVHPQRGVEPRSENHPLQSHHLAILDGRLLFEEKSPSRESTATSPPWLA